MNILCMPVNCRMLGIGIQIIAHIPVLDHNALRLACGTGCINTVSEAVRINARIRVFLPVILDQLLDCESPVWAIFRKQFRSRSLDCLSC